MKNILLVAGARPNFIKLAPLYDALAGRRNAYKPIIVHTGQHYDHQMSDVFFGQLNLPQPDINIGVGSGSHAEQTGNVMIEIERVLQNVKPDMVAVFGDVNSTMAASLAAVKLGIRIAHIEAGLRSNDWTMPEEVNRVVTDRVSTLLFTTCEDANINLLREGASENSIHFVGNIMIDTLTRCLPLAEECSILESYNLNPREYTLVTLHRPGNVDDREQLGNSVGVLRGLLSLGTVVFPIHPRTRSRMLEFELEQGNESVLGHPNLKLTEPLGYLEFLKLQKEAAVVVTDSGGVQEETTFLGVPCITVRPNTERPVTISEGTNTLVGMNPDRVVALAADCFDNHDSCDRRPPLWDGRTAERIVNVLDQFFGESPKDIRSTQESLSDVGITGGL
jgi:UDP-N-acetylglucosamine 2-epimerase (non-hydrolysing)